MADSEGEMVADVYGAAECMVARRKSARCHRARERGDDDLGCAMRRRTAKKQEEGEKERKGKRQKKKEKEKKGRR